MFFRYSFDILSVYYDDQDAGLKKKNKKKKRKVQKKIHQHHGWMIGHVERGTPYSTNWQMTIGNRQLSTQHAKAVRAPFQTFIFGLRCTVHSSLFLYLYQSMNLQINQMNPINQINQINQMNPMNQINHNMYIRSNTEFLSLPLPLPLPPTPRKYLVQDLTPPCTAP